jgi:hypothetical protein
VGIEMVQSAVGLLASVPAALVHALNLLVTSSRAFVLLRSRDGDKGVDLAGALLRRRRRRLSVDWVAGRQRRSSVLAVAGPVGARLRIHASARMGVAMRHVWIRRIRRVLPIRVGWTRSRNRRIYRHIVVRIDGVGLMAWPIVLGHGRTVLLLRHTSAAGAAGRMV